LCSLAASGPRAQAQPNLLGRFNGYGESHALPAVQRGASQLNVNTQRRGRFTGRLMVTVGIDPCWFDCDGSVMPNGVITGSGREEEGDVILFAGRTRIMGDGSVRLASLLYAEFGPQGNLQDVGITLYTQLQGGPNWINPGPVQDVSGHWMGDYRASGGIPGGGCIEFDLAQERNQRGGLTTAFGGTVHMDDVFVPAVQRLITLNMDAQGTVGVPAVQDGAAPFGAVSVEVQPGPSQGPGNGIVGILIGLLVPAVQNNGVPAVQGNYRLYQSFFDVFLDVAFERNTSINEGTFKAPKTGHVG
jgi:hypothetical protein